MRRSLFILILLSLAGCATGPSLQSRMAGYIGDNSQTLVQSLGVPDKQITINGVQYLAYQVRHSQQIESDGLVFGGYFGDPFPGPFAPPIFYDTGFPQQVDEFSCESTFMLKDDKVFNFTLRGNDCG